MKQLRFILTLSFMASALYHLYLAFFPSVPDAEIGKRHLAFLVVNVAAAGLLIMDRPRALLLFIPLMAQQIYSHGSELLTVWNQQQVIDWPSVIVLLGMPLLGFYIFKRNKEAR